MSDKIPKANQISAAESWELLDGALAIVGTLRKPAFIKYDSRVVRRADQIRGIKINFVVWLREPTEAERKIFMPSLIFDKGKEIKGY